MKYFALTFALVISLSVSLTADAQSFESLGGQSGNILVTTTPANPGPNQFVTITIESYATDLNRAEMSWFVNGKLEKESAGEKTFLFKTNGLGSVTNILILVKTEEGAVLQETVSIRPAALDLVWEAQSYTPPFYRGKALYPYQGTVKIVALPNIVTESGILLNAKSLVYTWKINGDNVTQFSGYGKNFMLFTGSIPLKQTKIEVEAESLDKKYKATGSVTLSPQSPQVLFYEDSPIYGVLYNKTLVGNATLQNEEIKIAGIPYFVGVEQRDETGLQYEWQLNNQIVSGGNSKSSLSFKQGTGGGGVAGIALQVSNPAKIFQFANNSLSLTFGQTPATNLFGTQ